MPTKTTAKLRKKGVVVSIYVEKPGKRNNTVHHHHHHHHYHVHLKQHQQQQQHRTGNNNVIAGKGHNRRAELLLYSRRLRESARPISLVSPFRSPPTGVGAVQRETKHNKAPTCPASLKIFNLKFCKSSKSVQIKQGSEKTSRTGPSIRSMIKSLEVTKKKGLVSRLMSMLQKRQ